MSYDASKFLEALDALEAEKNISKEVILTALKEAMTKSYRKELGGDDADVHVDIDPEKGTIELYQLKEVKENIEDDFLEISVEDANKLDKKHKYKEGDFFRIDASIEDLRTQTALTVRSVLRQKLAEIEKEALYNEFKDKIGTIITGTVEKVDERGLSVDIIKTTVYLPRKAMIGDEKFVKDDKIKLYVNDVSATAKTGARINVTRANDGFLKCLFFEQIPDVYDGTIEIKGIARKAGERSKVAVISNDPNVEPTGACIGQNGARIQRIVSQLGNGSVKEKIDIITYSSNPAIYIIEAMKPAHVLGIIMGDESAEEKKATVVVPDDSYSIAIGKRGVNVLLAGRLTGYRVDVITESAAAEQNLQYVSYEELQARQLQEEAIRIKEAQKLEQSEYTDYVAPDQRVYDDEILSTDLEEALEKEAEENEEVSVQEKETSPVFEETKEEVKVASKPTTEVKTTTTLEDLEKSIEDSKKKQNVSKKKFNKKKDEEEEESVKTVSDPSTYMSIYTEEELREIEAEENEEAEEFEDDIDYDEYEEYYDDER